jgi:hypothetical protein
LGVLVVELTELPRRIRLSSGIDILPAIKTVLPYAYAANQVCYRYPDLDRLNTTTVCSLPKRFAFIVWFLLTKGRRKFAHVMQLFASICS